MSLLWAPHSPTSLLAQQMRRDIRAHRREGPDGHFFVYRHLMALWAADYHTVLTHTTSAVWQHWARHPEHGWIPIGVHPNREAAQAAAEAHEWQCEPPPSIPTPGVYVLAGWPVTEGEVVYAIRTRCESKNSAIAVAETLRAIGMITRHEEISAE
jgi:hypothetical protein